VDWKNVVVPIITTIIVVFFGGTAVFSFIVNAFLTPDVNVNLSKSPNDKYSAYISVTNLGRVSAKQMTLTIDNPAKILNHTIFSTEEYSENKNYSNTHPKILKIFIPRFVQGEGSVINVNLKVDPTVNIDSGQYVVYTTYDQGSVRKILPVSEQAVSAEPEQFKYYDPIILGITAAVAAVIGIITNTFFMRAVKKQPRERR